VQGSNFVGKLTVADGAVRLIPVPTAGARPYGIVIDRAGAPWIALFGTNKLATVDPRTFVLREIALPRSESRVRRVVTTSDGRVWYADWAGGMVGAYDPATGQFEEWTLPSGAGSRPYAMVVDARDRLWIAETGVQPNRFVGFDTKAERFLDAATIPSGAGTVRHMMVDSRTNAVWFATDAHTVGRAVLP
jgi:virginiamycin B lyase